LNNYFLLVALGCGQCRDALQAGLNNLFVVFGTMHGAALAKFTAHGIPVIAGQNVYFYETG
jgi:hypothetical protein